MKKQPLQDLPLDAVLAFDVNVPSEVIGRYAKRGHIIATCAGEGEADEDFLSRAWSMGVTDVFSQDSDIGNIIEKENYDDMKWWRFV